MKYLTFAAIFCIGASLACGQQLSPTRFDLWTSDVFNPEGQQIIPAIVYESWTGIVYANTLGINQTNETFDGGSIGGDDSGISIVSIEGPVPEEVLIPEGILEQSIGNLIVRNNYFGDTQQFSVLSFDGTTNFVEPTNRLELYRYATGLFESDFETGFTRRRYAHVGTGTGSVVGPSFRGRMLFLPGRTDLNHDTHSGCEDLNDLSQEILQGTNDPNFDLNGDGTVDHDDHLKWREDAGIGFLDAPIAQGDANLDGQINLRDFHIWNANRFTVSSEFCSGDFNTDGVIDVADFNIWSESRGTGFASLVPEPSLNCWIFITILFATQYYRSHK